MPTEASLYADASCDNGLVLHTDGGGSQGEAAWWQDEERDRGERLASAVDEALTTLPLHLEKSIRDHFLLAPNHQLEDVRPGELSDALSALSRRDRAEILREFA